MFDHKAFATEGMYPGLATPQAIANRGTFLDLISRVVQQTIQAVTNAYAKVGAFLENKGLLASTTTGTGISASTATTKIMATQETKGSRASQQSQSMSASVDSGAGKVRTTKRKTINAK
jgi:hypothetical protein